VLDLPLVWLCYQWPTSPRRRTSSKVCGFQPQICFTNGARAAQPATISQRRLAITDGYRYHRDLVYGETVESGCLIPFF
jgi:hypothetical protein